MHSDKESNKNNPEEIKDDRDKLIHITEDHLIDLVETASHKTASDCFTHFEKFHKEEMEFQRRVQLEDREFERQKHHEEVDYQRRNARIDRWWKFFGIILAVAGFYLFWLQGLETEKAASLRAENQHKIDLIREDIAEKEKMLQTGSLAIVNLRSINHKILLACKYDHPYSTEQQISMRWTGREGVVQAFTTSDVIFNDNVYKEVQDLIQFDQSIKNICTSQIDMDLKIREFKAKIFKTANNSIKKDKERILSLK